MSWLCWSEASRLLVSPAAPTPGPAAAGTGAVPVRLGPTPATPPALGAIGPCGLDIVLIGTPSAPPPVALRTATAIIGEPGSTRIADSADRTTVCSRTSPKRDARGGVGVTRADVLATATSGRAEIV